MKLRKMANAALKRVKPPIVSGHDSYLDLKKIITDVEKPTPLPDREPTHLPAFLPNPKQLAEFSLDYEISASLLRFGVPSALSCSGTLP
jgi:hypothetical protein